MRKQFSPLHQIFLEVPSMEALCQIYALFEEQHDLVEKQEERIRRLEEQGSYHGQKLNSLEDQIDEIQSLTSFDINGEPCSYSDWRDISED